MPIVPSRVDFAYVALRNELRSGNRSPGSAISVKDTADALRVSPTPVREALERLVGEGLVTPTGSKGGFQVVRLSVAGLAQLIDLHGILADAASLRIHKQVEIGAALPVPDDPVTAIEGVFGTLFWERANAQIAISAARATVLLAPYRRFEPELFPEWLSELTSLSEAFSSGRIAAGSSIRSYHRRRHARAADMISACEDGA